MSQPSPAPASTPPPKPEQFTPLGEFQKARAMHAAMLAGEAAHLAAIPEWHAAQRRARLITVPAELGYQNHTELVEALEKHHRLRRLRKVAS